MMPAAVRGRALLRTTTRVALAAALACVVGLVLYRVVTGRSLGLRQWAASTVHHARSLLLSTLDRDAVRGGARGDFTNVIFLHHSVGENLIIQGDVRALLSAEGFALWDHGYNQAGLRDPNGETRGYDYAVPDDNTDPAGLAAIFAQKPYAAPLNTFSRLLQHEVIVFKSCFPVSHIATGGQLAEYQMLYQAMLARMAEHPDKLFIVVTPPPLNPAETDSAAAARARRFAEWLASDAFLAGQPNVATFNLFDLLAEPDPAAPDHNMLRQAYRDGLDSHPNRAANEAIGPLFADFIVTAAQAYRQRQAIDVAGQ